MTHQEERSAIRDLVDLAMEHGPDAMAAAFATLMNHAMQIEREQVLKAESHQRTADRQGYANGFKPKILNTRVGQIDLRIPQTRGSLAANGRPFYPKASTGASAASGRWSLPWPRWRPKASAPGCDGQKSKSSAGSRSPRRR